MGNGELVWLDLAGLMLPVAEKHAPLRKPFDQSS